MASTDARPVPQKGVAYRVYFVLLDADGDLVIGAAGLDSEVSIDGGNFADCTNEATEIQSTGCYFLDLTSSETNGDAIVVIVKTSTVGAKTTPVILYPEEAGDIRVNVTQFGSSNLTSSSGIPEVKVASHAAGAVNASALATDAVQEIADGIMTRASSNWEASAPAKSLGTAVMKAVHKIAPNGTDLEIFRSDGTTPHATQALTTDAALEPIESVGGAT